jgi:general stress protein YciG
MDRDRDAEAGREGGKVSVRAAERQFGVARLPGAVNREAGGVRPTVGQHRQHRGGKAPKFRLQSWVFEKQTGNATHDVNLLKSSISI